MMIQAASRQSPASTARCTGGHRRAPAGANAAAKSPGGAVAVGLTDEEFENQRSGRLASALLFMSVLVLMVDATRIILYSWFTDGSYLKFLYGSEQEIRWPKCSSGNVGLATDADQPLDALPTPPSPPVAVVITSLSRQRQQQQDDQQLDQFKASLMGGLTIAGSVLDAAVSSPTAPRRVAKPLVRVLFHASTVACLFFLAVAVFPAALRVRKSGGCGCCLLTFSLLFSLATLLAAGASAASSLMSVYFFSACELVPQVRRVYDFVPGCESLRRAFLCAECFSLIVVCASVCVLLHLTAYFCRAACRFRVGCGGCSRSCCCRREENGVAGSGGGGSGGGGIGGGTSDRYGYEMARHGRQPLTMGRSGYDEEEYLA